jgi:hypothetical protein
VARYAESIESPTGNNEMDVRRVSGRRFRKKVNSSFNPAQ